MNLYEHEAVGNIYTRYKIPHAKYVVATEPNEEVAQFVRDHGGAVVKAMVLVGKRGKAGAVKLVNTEAEAAQAVTDIMAMQVWGETPVAVMVCEKADIEAELYCSITYSTETRSPVITLSMQGGMDVEEIPEDRITNFPVAAGPAVEPYQIRDMLVAIGFTEKYGSILRQASLVIAQVYAAFWGSESRMIEINPLAIVRVQKKDRKSGEMVTALTLRALDAVISLDDDASVAPQKKYGERSAYTREQTRREIDALLIDRDDHRGKAGSYVEPEDLGGDIGMMTFGGGGSAGGMDVEEIPEDRITNFPVAAGPAVEPYQIRDMLVAIGFTEKYGSILRQASLVIAQVYAAFWGSESRMIEINPLAIVRVQKKDRKSGEMVTALTLRALDAVISLDDDASVAPQKKYGERSAYTREQTRREIDALLIDRDDHRGKAGSYVEPEDLGGDIGMMTFGGGGSAVTIETCYDVGLRPANFTDIGGNPPAEKMYAISRIILSKPGLKGILVCGGTASNTRIDVTLGEGLVNAIDDMAKEGSLDTSLIWVVRRGGPEVEKGLRLLHECFVRNNIAAVIYDSELPITEAPLILRDLLVKHRDYQVAGQQAQA